MKLRHAISTLATPLLSLTLVLSVSSMATAQDTAQDTRGSADQEAQGRVDSQQPGDTTSTPGMHVCENTHAPTGNPDLADRDNTQGADSDTGQTEPAEADTRTQIARAGDDCLDAHSSDIDDARGQGTGSNPDDTSGSQTREPQG